MTPTTGGRTNLTPPRRRSTYRRRSSNPLTGTFTTAPNGNKSDSRNGPLFFPVVLASSVIEGAYQLNIQGDANAWPIWEITGPGEDLLIENTETKERIFIQGEFGEKVNIDTRPTIAHIYSETKDEGELWERVDDDYRLFPLNPGLNKIRITMVNARPNSLVRLRYSETWLAGW